MPHPTPKESKPPGSPPGEQVTDAPAGGAGESCAQGKQ